MATTKLEQIAKEVAAGPHTGDVAFWTLEDVEIGAEDFRARWTAAGLPEDVLPRDPAPSAALRRAGQEVALALNAGRDDDAPAYLFRPAGRTGSVQAYNLVREARGAEAEVNEYVTVLKVRVDDSVPGGGYAHAGGPGFGANDVEVPKRMVDTYTRIVGTYSPVEVRAAIVSVIKRWSGVSLRESGGVYWVPATNAEPLRRLVAVVRGTGRSSMDLLPTHDSVAGNASLARAAQESIQSQIADLEAEMDRWASGATKGRAATLEARLAEFGEVKAKANLYADILSAKVAGLDERLAALTAQARALLDGGKVSPPPAKKPPCCEFHATGGARDAACGGDTAARNVERARAQEADISAALAAMVPVVPEASDLVSFYCETCGSLEHNECPAEAP